MHDLPVNLHWPAAVAAFGKESGAIRRLVVSGAGTGSFVSLRLYVIWDIILHDLDFEGKHVIC